MSRVLLEIATHSLAMTRVGTNPFYLKERRK